MGDRHAPSSTKDTTPSSSANTKPNTPAANMSKNKKGKKNADPVDQRKLLEQTMARLERDMAGDKEQELEIDREVKKARKEIISTASSADPIVRIDELQKKYLALFADMKKLERDNQKHKRRGDQLQKERDAAKTDLSKTATLKEKLEKLSRETSIENRKLRAELQQFRDKQAESREQSRRDIEAMARDVDKLHGQNEEEKEDKEHLELDEIFAQKFKSFIDQYEYRERHFDSVLRMKDLEIQCHMAKLEQQRKAQEMESSKSSQLSRQVCTFSQTETELRSQLNIYVEKFKQVEDTLNSSNDLFLTFRKEMEEMSKKTKRLEKENQTLTRKHEATNQNILKMAEERTRAAKELEVLRKKNANLEKLCRGMQAQGRGQVSLPQQEENDDGSESEYGYDEEDEDGSLEGEEEDDEDEESEAHHTVEQPAKRPFGPVPPPKHNLANGAAVAQKNRQAARQSNGVAA